MTEAKFAFFQISDTPDIFQKGLRTLSISGSHGLASPWTVTGLTSAIFKQKRLMVSLFALSSHLNAGRCVSPVATVIALAAIHRH